MKLDKKGYPIYKDSERWVHIYVAEKYLLKRRLKDGEEVHHVNGDKKDYAEETCLSDLIESLNLSTNKYAIEVNEEIISRSHHQKYIIKENDTVEVIVAVGGG